jgi:CRP-like cAMP-binding protein
MKPLLKTASDELRETLSSRANLRTYHSNEELFAAGERADFLPVIVKGKAKMVQFPDAGKEVIIGIFGEGEMFAVPPVIDGKAYRPMRWNRLRSCCCIGATFSRC